MIEIQMSSTNPVKQKKCKTCVQDVKADFYRKLDKWHCPQGVRN